MPNNPESNIQNQYRIIAAGAGWIDRSARGRIRFSGRDAAPFLQALVSNEIAALSAGQGTYATYLTPQGRMIADLRIGCSDRICIVAIGFCSARSSFRVSAPTWCCPNGRRK
jgi:glycine cleavage system aminomethyltransferase T